jgi:hypothetical protein
MRHLWIIAPVAVAAAVPVLAFSSTGESPDAPTRPAATPAAATATPTPAAALRAVARTPRCFGAASRDPLAPCRNRALRLRVTPSPRKVATLPNAPCPKVGTMLGKQMCGLGVKPEQAQRRIALVGDSHAGMWRAAIDHVADELGWAGTHMGHASCPLNTALRDLPEPNRTHCARWKRRVFAWFDDHPEVDTLFVSQLSGGSGVVPAGGRNAFETAVAGYRAAWRKLPSTVKHIIVIRDTPKAEPWTLGCVARAMARHRQAAKDCANRRSEALDADPAAVAAKRTRGGRVHLLDMTRIFCGRKTCLPVIGGVLVHKDTTHLTATFTTTLGDPLLRRVRSLPVT